MTKISAQGQGPIRKVWSRATENRDSQKQIQSNLSLATHISLKKEHEKLQFWHKVMHFASCTTEKWKRYTGVAVRWFSTLNFDFCSGTKLTKPHQFVENRPDLTSFWPIFDLRERLISQESDTYWPQFPEDSKRYRHHLTSIHLTSVHDLGSMTHAVWPQDFWGQVIWGLNDLL